MTPNEAIAALRELGSTADESVTWQRDGIAYALLSAPSNPRFAVISTPGDRWCEVAVNDGFTMTHFSEDDGPDVVRETLARLSDIGLAWVSNGGRLRGSRRLFPRLEVRLGDDVHVLRRSLAQDIRLIGRLPR